MSEFFDIVDAEGRVIGRASRAECHGNPRLLHRAVHVLVYDSSGRLYLQRRSESKDVQPGKWDSSVGGHVAVGESWEQAAARELAEELGVRGVAPEGPLYEYRISSAVESELVRSYRLVYDGPIRPDPEEIAEGRFWSLEEIRANLGQGVFTPNFEEEFRRASAWAAEHPAGQR